MASNNASDFHVLALHYELLKNDSVSYTDPPAVSFETPEAKFSLTDGVLTCQMKIHCTTETQAKNAIEPLLRAWEIETDFKRGRGEFRFKFSRSEIVDRTPTQPGKIRLEAGVGMLTLTGFAATLTVGRRSYPSPPTSFRLTPEAQSIWVRYEGYVEGREPLLSMCYFCLTVLTSAAGGFQEASTFYRINLGVLKKIGELTSLRGNNLIARKAATQPTPELKDEERNWLESAIKLLILRAGEPRELNSLPMITMADLPNL